jgi:hypothetical protein
MAIERMISTMYPRPTLAEPIITMTSQIMLMRALTQAEDRWKAGLSLCEAARPISMKTSSRQKTLKPTITPRTVR